MGKVERRTVLLVEDNAKLSEINRRALESEGYHLLTALTLTEAREHLKNHTPDVILLDVLLPDGNGIDFCGAIRDGTTAHILFLTSRTEHEDRIRGLDIGGDDYITKPYKLEEMLSRVRAAVRRRHMDDAKPPVCTLTRGPLTLDVVASSAFINGVNIELTKKEFMILLLLLQNEGKNLSKEYLYENVWKQPLAGDGGAFWRQMSTLKKKLGEGGDRILLTAFRGEGYALEIIE